MIVVLYLIGVLAALFVASGVGPRYLRWKSRGARVEVFEHEYHDYLTASDRDYQQAPAYYGGTIQESNETVTSRAWLAARRSEMQRDAESVGEGVIMVAPPPAVGGGRYLRHGIFEDLFSTQSFTDYPRNVRLDALATIRHEIEVREAGAKRDLINPWAWTRLTFERMVRFPGYVLRLAGLGGAADSMGGRVVTAVWSFAIGLSGIGGFVLGLISFLNKQG